MRDLEELQLSSMAFGELKPLTYYFATDSRVSIERWIEVLSLAATGRLDVIAPYPPYFCAEQSGDELKSRSRESLLSSEVRLVLFQKEVYKLQSIREH